MYTVYILFSKTLDKYYIGFTGDDVHARLQKHLYDHKGFTAKAKDWKIMYTQVFNTKHAAMIRERQIKNWKNKDRIAQFILRSST